MNGFLLDTNALCELVKRKPNRGFISWLTSVPEESIHLSVLTIGEILTALHMLPDSEKRSDFYQWVMHDLTARFGGRILVCDFDVAQVWAKYEAHARRTEKTLPVVDALLVATAVRYNLTLVTPNQNDFADVAVQVLNPWR